MTNQPQTPRKPIDPIDGIMLLIARDTLKKMGRPEFLLADDYQMIAALKRHFTLVVEDGNWSLVPRQGVN